MRLYDYFKNPEQWDQNLPIDLIPPIKHLRKTLDDNHWTFGQVTEKPCYWQPHPESQDDGINDYLKPFQQLKGIAGAPATERLIELLKMKTEPATFKAFFDLYLDSISVTAIAIFHELVAVGKVNEHRLGAPHLEWAEAQTKNMIRKHVHAIRIWIRNVCDKQPFTLDDMDEQLHWRKWQAPMLLVMKPSRYMPYDPARVWERNDSDTSAGWLESFAEHYVLHVEAKLEKVAGHAALELAKDPPPHRAADATVISEPTSEAEALPSKLKRTPRELQKLATQAKYLRWRQELRPNAPSARYPSSLDKRAPMIYLRRPGVRVTISNCFRHLSTRRHCSRG